MRAASPISFLSSSNTGCIALQGPHQVAKKSTKTGFSDCITSLNFSINYTFLFYWLLFDVITKKRDILFKGVYLYLFCIYTMKKVQVSTSFYCQLFDDVRSSCKLVDYK